MRYLLNDNDTNTIKAGDSSETIRLSARNDNEPVTWADGDTAKIHVDKDNAHVKDIDAQLVVGSNNVTVDSGELADLPAGNYQMELWTTLKATGDKAIWPSKGMLDFTIDKNADSLEGGKITTITLDDFKKQLNDAIVEASKKATQGPEGKPGKDGKPGPAGKSAYQLAVESGFKGTETEWLKSLSHGPEGPAGKSAYQLAVDSGFKGSEDDWLASLKGKQGPAGAPGKDGANGQPGPEGKPGKDGQDGKPGKDGAQGVPGPMPNVKIGEVTTGAAGTPAKADVVKVDDSTYKIDLTIPQGAKGETGGVNQVVKPDLSIGNIKTLPSGSEATAELVKSGETSYVINLGVPAGADGKAGKNGKDGKDGKPGADGQPGQPGKDGAAGKSAYQVAVDNGFTGTEVQWLTSLKGVDGKPGKDGVDGKPGRPGKDGKDGSMMYVSTEIPQKNSLDLTKVSTGDTTLKPGDYVLMGNATLYQVSAVDTTNNYFTVNAPGVPFQGPNGLSAYDLAVNHGYQGSESDWLASLKGKDGKDGSAAETNLGAQDGFVTLNGQDTGAITEARSRNLQQSTFSYADNIPMRVISKSNFKTWVGMQNDGDLTLDVDTATVTADNDSKKTAQLKPGIYNLRDINSYGVNVKSSEKFGLTGRYDSIWQIVQLIITPHMHIATAVCNEYNDGTKISDTVVDSFWRSSWDGEYSFSGVTDSWHKIG